MKEEDLKRTGGVTLEEAAEVIKAGHPPIANKVALIDFDGTLYPFGHLFNFPAPLPDAAETVKMLKEKGYRIGIFTSRLSKRWLATVNQNKKEHRLYIKEICKRDSIPVDFITAEKVPAEFYIDDKAIRYEDSWKKIQELFT